jgi:colanic acid/amylovoran biosynthesis glycosyltransferase
MPFRHKIGYLISQYPAVSHTFVQREVFALRSKGFMIHTASINETNIKEEQLLPNDREEMNRTYYIKKQGVLIAVGELVKTFVTKPLQLLKGIYSALKLANFNIKKMFLHLCYLVEALLVAKWMKKTNISHVHVHFANPASTVALILTKIYPYTYSMTIHGPDEFYDVTLYNLKEKIEGAEFIFCISYYTRSQIMRLSLPEAWKKMDVVPLGVDPDFYTPIVFREHPSPFEILCVGRMTLTKGQEILLQAVKKILAQGKNIRLCFVGDGPEKERLEEIIKKLHLQDSIVFKGALNTEETFRFFKQTDIFALSSLAEGVPIVLMEAMSMEIPCIATAINGIPELIKNEINGLLVPASNTEETVNAILRLMEDRELRQNLGKAARLTILDKYNLNKNTDNLITCFEKRLS